MFIANLKHEEKAAFLNLACLLIASDGVLSEEEVLMVEQYKNEMNLHISSNQSWEEEAESIAVFKDSSTVLQRQIVFELVALACADKDYAVEEHALIERVSKALGLDDTFIKECKMLVEEVTVVYDKIGKLMGE